MMRRKMEPFSFSHLVVSIIVVCLWQATTYAVEQSYVVYMGEHPHCQNHTLFDLEKATKSHFNLLGSIFESVEQAQANMIYSYSRCINGFAAILSQEQVTALQKHPAVISVFPNRLKELHTTRSWDFLGLPIKKSISSDPLGNTIKKGQDIIISNLDTGVWPESPSFSDQGFGPVPKRWRGICERGNNVTCNRKLIGARNFNKGSATQTGLLKTNTDGSVRDTQGHGTHTLSTAGGSIVAGANIFGAANGTARGGSPNARVAAYKVCGENGCFDADILAGFEAAISDGVDVISMSLGGPAAEFNEDSAAIGALHATKKGISVVASAGNDGPFLGTATNLAPWFITVGASTLDRVIASYVTLGNKKVYKGTAIVDKSLPSGKFYPLMNAALAGLPDVLPQDAQLCEEKTLDPKKVKGKIIVCVRGDNGRVEKGYQASLAGAVGMILANDRDSGNEILADPHVIPASHITYEDGQSVIAYINTTKNPQAYISPIKTEIGKSLAPVMAAFSSRGPSSIEPAILKPDITAPGVGILAAYTEAVGPSEASYDKRRVPFTTMSGTSMSCPHISGVVGYLKAIHPDWSPAAIKSAIMTTAATTANNKKPILDFDGTPATPFAYGAGHVQPEYAADPGLVYDLTVDDYENFLCAHNQSRTKEFSDGSRKCPKNYTLADFNYPSITIPNLNGPVTATRRVKNVGPPATYKVSVKAPAQVSVVVEPTSLTFKKTGEEKVFRVTFKPKASGSLGDYVFGQLIWSDGRHNVRSPLAVKHS